MTTTRTKTHTPPLSRVQLLATVMLALILSVALPSGATTSTIQLSLKPNTQALAKGSVFSVQIHLIKNDNTFVDYVRADLNFPASLLSVSSVSTQGGYFTINVGPQYTFTRYDNNAGTIDVGGQSSGVAKTGDFLVATVNFITKNAGTSAVSFNSQSIATYPRNGSNMLTGTSGGVYTITSPPPPPPGPTPPPPSPTPTPTPGPKPTPPPTPTAGRPGPPSPTPSVSPSPSNAVIPTDTTSPSSLSSPAITDAAPAISHVVVKRVSSDTVDISWQTDQATPTEIHYGSSADNLAQVEMFADTTTDHTVTLTMLAAGKAVYFEIVAANATQQTLYHGNVTTPGSSLILIASIAGAGLLLLIIFGLLWFKKRRELAPPSMGPSLLPTQPLGEMNQDLSRAQASEPSAPPQPVTDKPLVPPPPPPTVLRAAQASPSQALHTIRQPAPVPVTPPTTSPSLAAPSVKPAIVATPPKTPLPPVLPPVASQPPQPTAPTPLTPSGTKDEPDMFDLGERRLDQENLLPKEPPK